jgi:hypothetical protein
MSKGIRRLRARALSIALAVAVVAIAAFEGGVRLLPHDAETYDVQTIGPGAAPNNHARGVITDPATIARWRSLLTAQPTDQSLLAIYLSNWQGTDTCSKGAEDVATYRFTWHGLPVEVVSNAPSCVQRFQVTSGGLLDWRTSLVAPAPRP